MTDNSVTSTTEDPVLSDKLQAYRQRHSDFLQIQLTAIDPVCPRLHDAMRYAVLLGGKRVRPFLVYAVGEMLGAEAKNLDGAAAAIECIHAYSLVHDDLPAMDDDDLRRGQATCHKAFDEATAILAGDALQSLAFELISRPLPGVSAVVQLNMVRTLAQAAGAQGMCAGQSLDLRATNRHVDLDTLERIHHYKTGALIEAAVELGLLLASDVAANTRADQQSWLETSHHLRQWARLIGLAFQVQDDILDVIGDTQVLGKQQGADAEQQKSTYPALMGLASAQSYLTELAQKALHALDAIPYNTEVLAAFTHYLITRDR
ncbi:(2E,6E)-farnesyl diphosphate synthase [Aliidiomarina sedimenti]|uniref:(2E,6E)-farnesyl diphosphate synthase n=1 Tax=Aliidiomarina sedimenti TaxID=1933879 RepID=A0ABY0BVA0_9GAMM|nr:(2E,6E)-farnesyl diphosphate synthase [Aliidiomarina sedimenti]